MTANRLFDVDTKTRRTLAGNLPVPVDPTRCPDCAAPTVTIEWADQALFIGGGYDANLTHTIRHCTRFCGWGLTVNVAETTPKTR